MNRAGILFLGDSISLGYRDIVKYNLRGCCEVLFPREQGKFASDLYRMLYEWKKYVTCDRQIDMVYWNAGLWDVVRIFGDEAQTSVDDYKKYLEKVCLRLRKLFPKAKICFATTTPVVEERYTDEFFRKNSDIEKYNKAAECVLKDKVDFFDDLYSFMQNIEAKNYRDATYFTYDANQKIAAHICGIIRNTFKDEIDAVVQAEQLRVSNINKVIEDVVRNKLPLVTWGAGKIFNEHKNFISSYCNLKALVDKDRRIQGSKIDGIQCIAPDDITSDIFLVVITINNFDAQCQIGDICNKKNISWCTYEEFMDCVWRLYEDEMLKKSNYIPEDCDPDAVEDMKKYIGISILENTCNLDCEYCYLRTNPNRRYEDIGRKNPHNPLFVRKQLSRKALGGSCLIGLTASGETLLADKFVDICIELLKEGHYLHIVTNGTAVAKIEEIINRAGKYAKHIIFKLSFHYIQLKNKGLLEKFVEAVRVIEKSQASYTIEIMPHDELVPFISEVMDFSMKNFGALPHLTIGRNENDKMKLLTNGSFTEYNDTWKVFDSIMFDMRMKLYLTKGRDCNAGPLSFFVDLYSGRIDHCVYYENAGNLYLDGISGSKLDKVGDSCPMESCFNCHVYAPFGILPMEDVPTYYTIRDRKKADGTNWIKDDMRRYLDVKLDGLKNNE